MQTIFFWADPVFVLLEGTQVLGSEAEKMWGMLLFREDCLMYVDSMEVMESMDRQAYLTGAARNFCCVQ